MPRRHRAGIAPESPGVTVTSGQVWQHRWNGNEATVLAVLAHNRLMLVHATRTTTTTRDVLVRDYRLVS